ncbi:MAG: hypothetical protein ACREF8_06770, partial [Chthoniobacterales bacterium]
MHTERREKTKKAISEWLTNLSTVTGLSFTKIAERAVLAPSTLYNAADPKKPHLLSTDSIDKLVSTFGVAPPGGRGNTGFREPSIVPFEGPTLDPEKKLHPDQSRWEVKDRALDLLGYLPGDVILVDRRVQARAGDIVYAQIIDHNRGTADSVLRKYDPPFVVVATADPALQHCKPLIVDHERVDIIATVILST